MFLTMFRSASLHISRVSCLPTFEVLSFGERASLPDTRFVISPLFPTLLNRWLTSSPCLCVLPDTEFPILHPFRSTQRLTFHMHADSDGVKEVLRSGNWTEREWARMGLDTEVITHRTHQLRTVQKEAKWESNSQGAMRVYHPVTELTMKGQKNSKMGKTNACTLITAQWERTEQQGFRWRS